MIEYLYNAIKATAGEEIIITANITDATGAVVTSGCHLNLYDNEKTIETVNGTCVNGMWEFVIPAVTTANLAGRYWYCICSADHKTYNFKQPIYLV